MAFTLVFDGELKDFKGNPFKTDTPFGRPVAACVGDALTENDELRQALDGVTDEALIANGERFLDNMAR